LHTCSREARPVLGTNRPPGAPGFKIADSTVCSILRAHGLGPAPERKRQTTWQAFLKAHYDVLAAINFTTVEVWTQGGLVTFYLLFVLELATRRMQLAGCTINPTEGWMMQAARSLTDLDLNKKSSSRSLNSAVNQKRRLSVGMQPLSASNIGTTTWISAEYFDHTPYCPFIYELFPPS
jgi:hypothetical protein